MNIKYSRSSEIEDSNFQQANKAAYEFGVLTELNSRGVNADANLFQKIASTDLDNQQIKADIPLANAISKFLGIYGENSNTFSSKLFKKIASCPENEWNSFYEDCIKIASEVITKFAYPITLGANVIGRVGGAANEIIPAAAKVTTLGIPAAGAAMGAGTWMIDRGLNEDDDKTEKIRAKIVKYKLLAARLDREINSRFADKAKLQSELEEYRVLG